MNTFFPARTAAQRFVEQYCASCSLAVLGGSASRGEHTAGSDLDLVIFDNHSDEPGRRTTSAYGWILEIFILTEAAYRDMFDEGIDSANPALQRMIAEGVVLHSDSAGLKLIEEARADLDYGPMSWSTSELDLARYMITDQIEDLRGGSDLCESWFIAGKLSQLLCEFHLRVHRQWIGEGKHLYRYLKSFDPDLAQALESSLAALYRVGQCDSLVELCISCLSPYGGLLREGFEQ